MKKAILATKVGMTQIFNEDGVLTPSQKTVDALSKLEMPAGVFINLKVMN